MELTTGNGTVEHRAAVELVPWWCFLVAGPLVFTSTLIHLCVGKWYTGVHVSSDLRLDHAYNISGMHIIYIMHAALDIRLTAQ